MISVVLLRPGLQHNPSGICFPQAVKSEINKVIFYRHKDRIMRNLMIDKIIQKIDAETMLYIINALSFDAEWENVYNKNSIRKGNFTDITGKKSSVDMMHSKENIYLECEDADGYFRDRCIFSEEIDIEDSVSVNVSYKKGAVMRYEAIFQAFPQKCQGSDRRKICRSIMF